MRYTIMGLTNMYRNDFIRFTPKGNNPHFSDTSCSSKQTFSRGPLWPITFKHAGGDDFSSEFHPELKLNYLLPKRPLHSLSSPCESGVTSKVRFGHLTNPDPRENDAGMESSLSHHLLSSNDRYNEKEDSNSKVVNYLVNVYYLVNVNYLDPKRTTKAT